MSRLEFFHPSHEEDGVNVVVTRQLARPHLSKEKLAVADERFPPLFLNSHATLFLRPSPCTVKYECLERAGINLEDDGLLKMSIEHTFLLAR